MTTTARGEGWVFMVPVGNLRLTEAVGREFRVDRVTFVDKDKLPHVRKRLGLHAPVSEIKRRIRDRDFFESAPAFAVVRQGGTPEEVEQRCLELVREEAAMLMASQLGYSSRGQMRPVVDGPQILDPAPFATSPERAAGVPGADRHPARARAVPSSDDGRRAQTHLREGGMEAMR